MKNRSCVPGQSVAKGLHGSMIVSDISNYILTLDRTNVGDVGNSLLEWTLSTDIVSLTCFFSHKRVDVDRKKKIFLVVRSEGGAPCKRLLRDIDEEGNGIVKSEMMNGGGATTTTTTRSAAISL